MAEPAITQDEQSLKQRAMRRLAIALTLIAAAIVALALLDRYNASLKKTEPVVVQPPEPPAPLAQPPARQSSAPPSSTEEPGKPPPPPPIVDNQQQPAHPAPESSTKKPITTGPSPEKPGAAPEKPATPILEEKPAPPTATSKPSAQAATPTPAPSQPTASSKGFIVQVGVFMSAANARTLQNKLAEKGIPTHTETRVVVGPFKDRAEAEAVIRQLKELGVGGVVAAPPGAQ